MKQKNKIIISCIVIACMLLGSISLLTDILKPAYIGDVYNTIDTFHALPEESVEVMIYGSSHAWKGLDAMYMYKRHGIGAYNYGANWQRINTTALFIKDSLRTQSPKVILIEAYNINTVHETTGLNGEIYYTNRISWFEGKAEYLRQCFGNDPRRYLSYYFPLIYFHGNWSNLTKWNFVNPTDTHDFGKTMGYLPSKKVTPVNIPDPSTFNQAELDPAPLAVLDEIVEICRQNNIEIIFYTVPYAGTYSYSSAMKEYAEENGCCYIDFFEKMEDAGLDGRADFQDTGHLNDSGSKKVAAYLGQYIVDHFDVTDMRMIEDNLWQEALRR